jgi:aerobic-type carbon monoxide dehydrogenase small subunit (CoxS/CutS family)
MPDAITFTLNGEPVSVTTSDRRHLLWVLRSDLGLTGTKYGCGKNHCGACTMLVDGRAIRSCRYPMSKVAGKEVVTIEGLARDGALHPLQKAFVEHDALQCGFCTPGMIMNAVALLQRNAHPSREQILRGMNRNLCRCGSHTRVVRAIESAARQMKGGE